MLSFYVYVVYLQTFLLQFVGNQHPIFMHILCALFDGTVQFANTKKLPLISGTSVTHRDCHAMQQYLLGLDRRLNVEAWNKETSTDSHYNQNSKRAMAKLRKQLHALCGHEVANDNRLEMKSESSAPDLTVTYPPSDSPSYCTFSLFISEYLEF